MKSLQEQYEATILAVGIIKGVLKSGRHNLEEIQELRDAIESLYDAAETLKKVKDLQPED